jgi:hypothetical protein
LLEKQAWTSSFKAARKVEEGSIATYLHMCDLPYRSELPLYRTGISKARSPSHWSICRPDRNRTCRSLTGTTHDMHGSHSSVTSAMPQKTCLISIVTSAKPFSHIGNLLYQ